MRNLTKEETLVVTEDGGGNSLKRVISTNGSVALKSGAINFGAKSVTVNVSANPQGQISIYLKNPIKTIDHVDLANYSNKTHSYTFDLNSCSDLDMENIYVEVVMYAKDVGPDTGTLPGDVVSLKAKVALDSITVRY